MYVLEKKTEKTSTSVIKTGAADSPSYSAIGWPLSADDWDAQMLFFLSKGYRVIAHDRRGHGRSTHVGDRHDLDHYADDLKAVTEHLNLKDGEDAGQSARLAQIGVRRSPSPTRC